MNELVIVRHGQSYSNVTGVLAGPGCRGLTADGRAAARAVADRMTSQGRVQSFVCSPTRRAKETAEIISARTQFPVVEMAALRVADPGLNEGMTRQQWRATDAVERQRRGSESWCSYLTRSSACLADLLSSCRGRTLVVGHTETVIAAFSLLLGATDLGRLGISVDYTAVTSFREFDGKWQLVGYNDVSHLPPGIARYPGALSPLSSSGYRGVGGHDPFGHPIQRGQ